MQMSVFWLCVICAMFSLPRFPLATFAKAAADESAGVYPSYVNGHNYGYILKYDRELRIASYDARLIFHMTLPDWQVEFDNVALDCRAHVNRSIVRQCLLMIDIRNAVRWVSSYSQRYIQQQVKRTYHVVQDLPIDGRDRTRRGALTDILSHVTGLATIDDLKGVQYILEQIQTGVFEAAKLWGSGACVEVYLLHCRYNRIAYVMSLTFWQNIGRRLGRWNTNLLNMPTAVA